MPRERKAWSLNSAELDALYYALREWIPRPTRAEFPDALRALEAEKLLQVEVDNKYIVIRLLEGKTLRIARPPAPVMPQGGNKSSENEGRGPSPSRN